MRTLPPASTPYGSRSIARTREGNLQTQSPPNPVRLTESEAQLYQEWIANDRRLRRLIQQMRQIAAKAAELKLKDAASP
jgi:hypothetical protein